MRSASSREIAWSPLLRAHRDGACEGRVGDDLDARPGHQPELCEVAKQLGVAVRDTGHGCTLARLEVDQRPVATCRDAKLAVRDRVAVRVVGREAELRVDLRLELLGEGVLQELCLGVHLVEREPEPIHEVALEQPVMAEDLERAAASLLRQRDSAVGSALDEAELGEPLRHRGRRGSADTHARGERRRRQRARPRTRGRRSPSGSPGRRRSDRWTGFPSRRS